MDQAEKRALETRLVAMGLNGIDDPEICLVFARIIEDFPGDKHWFYRGMLNQCDPAKRREMYYSLKPKFTRFKPLPLETYLAQIAEQAGAMVSQRIMRVEGPQPKAIRVGEEYYAPAGNSDGTHTLMRLTCSKCTKQQLFLGDTLAGAMIRARKKGWVRDGDDEICPKCPAVREKVGAA